MSLARSLRSPVAITLISLMILGPILGNFPSEAMRFGKATSLTNADWSFLGENRWNFFGTQTIIVHDVNGDGYDDLLVTAPYNNNSGGDQTGKIYLYFGSPQGWSKDTSASKANASFIGEETGTGLELKAAAAGDVNGDGLGDFVVGLYRKANTDGKAYLFFGKKSGWTQNVSFSQADASFIGSGHQDLGMSVASAGDVNGDGYDDILVGAPYSMKTLSCQGAAYLILGKSQGWARNVPIQSAATASIFGESGNDLLGFSVSSAGDVNGDGLDDIILGAWANSEAYTNSGEAYLFMGRTSGWHINMDASAANASFRGEGVNSYAGYHLAGGGDVNGDGLSDFLISAIYDCQNGTNAGQVYLVLGHKNGWQTDVNLTTVNASFLGSTYMNLAETMDLTGDINGDGLDDILIGVPRDSPYNLTGRTYVIPGKTTGWAIDTNLGDSPYSLVGEGLSNNSGEGVSNAGDLNGDGLDDISLGAGTYSTKAQYAGKAYVLFADKNLGPSSASTLTAFSDPGYTTDTLEAAMNTTVYVELKGQDANPAKADLALVHVTSTGTVRDLTLRLRETGPATGVFRGPLTVLNRTDLSRHCIGAKPNGLINLSFVSDPSVNLTLYVTLPDIMLFPKTDVLSAVEDNNYSVQYYSRGKSPSLTWALETNANWLHLPAANHTLWGIPNNSAVGTSWVKLTAQAPSSFKVSHFFNITVTNVAPKLLTTDVTHAVQGQEYRVDYQADDEGQGNTSWALATNASWLHINSTTGVLSGTPGPYNVSTYWCNVSVNDGNGGIKYSRFNIVVADVNDGPTILTQDVLTAVQDVPYSVTYTATDPDPGDSQQWTFSTNSTWLHFNGTNRTLWGTPRNSDVGPWHVTITVRDHLMVEDKTDFVVTVQNVNDRPFFVSITNKTVSVLDILQFEVLAKDIDRGTRLQHSIKAGPTNMTIDPWNGTLSWVPTKEQKGSHIVRVEVSDGNLSATTNFTVTVVVPRPKLLMPANGTILKSLVADLRWSLDLNSTLPISYEIFLGDGAVLSEVQVSDGSAKNATISGKLKDLVNYRWYIVPMALAPGDIKVRGDRSEIWSFSVDIPKPFVTVELLSTASSTVRGKTIQVWVTIFNRGNTDGNVTLIVESDFPSAAFSFIDKVNLKAGTSARLSMKISIPNNAVVGKHPVSVKATLGNYTGTGSVELKVDAAKPRTNPLSGQLLILLVLMVVVIAVLIAGVAYMSHHRRRAEADKADAESEKAKAQSELATVKETAASVENFNLDDIFLIYNDGRLMTHVSYKAAAMDDQIFSSMLVALQGFVKDSFRTDDALSRFDYGTRKMVLEKGKFLILAVALSGTEPSMLKENMHTLIQKLEGLYAGVVENWDGDLKQFKDVNLLLSPLFDIKKGLKIRAEKEEVKVKSGIEFFGGYVRLKVAISNELSGPIEDVRLNLVFDNMTLQLSHIDPEYPREASTVMMGSIPASEKRTVAFYLDPLICQESNVEATVSFKDAHGSVGEASMKKRPVDIVCPLFYTPETINVAMLRRLMAEVQYKDSRLYVIPEWTDPLRIFSLGMQAASLHSIRVVREFELTEPSFIGEAWFYGKVSGTDEEMVLRLTVRADPKLLEIFVATNNLSSQAGLLAEVSKNIGKMCQEQQVCTLVPCTDQKWKDYISSCGSLLDQYGVEPTEGPREDKKGPE